MENETRKMSVPFTQVANSLLNDESISFKAKGIYSFLYSKPSGWNFSANRIAKQSKDGRSAILEGLKELENVGYLKREKQKDGTVIYNLNYEPKCGNQTLGSEKPKCGFRTVGKVHCAETEPISNKEDIVIKNISNKEVEAQKINPAIEMRNFLQNPEDVTTVLINAGMDGCMVRSEILKFINYWSELTKSGKKQRWELERTFELKRRLATWFRNSKKFNNNYSNAPKGVRIS